MAEIIDGKAIAKAIKDEVARGVEALGGPAPQIVAVEIGEDDASASYVRNQARQAKKVGIDHRLDRLPAEATESEVEAHIKSLNADDKVTGIMLQMPLPKHLDERRIRAFIAAEKDVEAITEVAAGRLVAGTHTTAPCTALAARDCLWSVLPDLSGVEVAVVGRSEIVGRPLAMLLLHANATVTICHSRTKDLGSVLRRQDAVLVAVGRPGLVSADMIRPDATVIDVGTNWIEDAEGGHLEGDVDFESVSTVASNITPVPGGVGPVTVAILLRNTLALANAKARN